MLTTKKLYLDFVSYYAKKFYLRNTYDIIILHEWDKFELKFVQNLIL